MTDDGFSLFRLVEEYDGPPLRMLLAGAGSFAMRVLEVPGASRVLDSIQVPYSTTRTLSYLMDNHPNDTFAKDVQKVFHKTPAVSQQMCEWLHECNSNNLQGCAPLTVTAAITSKKQRQGQNHAFIGAGMPNAYDIWHVQLHKLDDVDFEDRNKIETRRFLQDRIISEIALSLATGITSHLRNEMQEAGYLEKV